MVSREKETSCIYRYARSLTWGSKNITKPCSGKDPIVQYGQPASEDRSCTVSIFPGGQGHKADCLESSGRVWERLPPAALAPIQLLALGLQVTINPSPSSALRSETPNLSFNAHLPLTLSLGPHACLPTPNHLPRSATHLCPSRSLFAHAVNN